MPKLIINAPSSKKNKAPFDKILKSGIGPRYAIPKWIADIVNRGCDVVLLDTRGKRRSEGTLIKDLVKRDKTGIGMQRYDVFIDDIKTVPYKPEKLNRWGTGYSED